MASEIPWQTIGSVGVGVLATIGTFYSIRSNTLTKQVEARLQEAQADFEREKNRRANFVADIERCETRLDEVQASLQKIQTDYAELYTRYLAECQAHADTRLELAALKRRMDEMESEKKVVERERDTIRSEYEAYQRLVKNTAVGATTSGTAGNAVAASALLP